MKKVLIPLADGFEEIEAVTIIDILRRAGIQVTVAGIKPGQLNGAHKIKLTPETALAEVKDQDFDMIILPGGQPGVDNLRKDPRVLEILKKMKAGQKHIGAICAAPIALRDAGLIAGLRLTSYPGYDKELEGSRYEENRVVVDGKFVTSRGPGTAMEFSLKIVEILIGKQKADELAEAVIAR
ncbi:MAG: DJ-1/PfpI family protein [Candidatus Omnitrophica bacterium]|nr:DJ-1/PfpI family protein [Candidatus Omnitrophota bacterium]